MIVRTPHAVVPTYSHTMLTADALAALEAATPDPIRPPSDDASSTVSPSVVSNGTSVHTTNVYETALHASGQVTLEIVSPTLHHAADAADAACECSVWYQTHRCTKRTHTPC